MVKTPVCRRILTHRHMTVNKKSSPGGRGGFLSLRLFEMQLFKDENQTIAGQQPVDQKGDDNADAGINDAIERVGNIGLNRGIEQQYAQHDAAGLDCAGPVEQLAYENKHHDAHEKEGQECAVDAAFGIEDDIQSEQRHAEESAEQGAEETVAAMETGIGHIAAEAEDGADAGEGGIAADDEIQKRAQSCGNSGLYIALTYMKLEIGVSDIHIILPLFGCISLTK